MSAAGLSEPAYHHLTYDLTLAAAEAVARLNPGMTSVYVSVASPLVPALKAMVPNAITTTEQVGRAMLRVAKLGAPRPLIEQRDIIELGVAGARAAS